MTYVIAEPCIDVLDISCVSVCPVDCIHYEEGTDRKLFIDPNECIDCGACEPECPVNAIFPEESLPPEWASYTQIDATWYTDKAAARAAARSVYQVASMTVKFAHSAGTWSSGKMAFTGHSGSQAPQSMHSFGSMYSFRSTPSS